MLIVGELAYNSKGPLYVQKTASQTATFIIKWIVKMLPSVLFELVN